MNKTNKTESHGIQTIILQKENRKEKEKEAPKIMEKGQHQDSVDHKFMTSQDNSKPMSGEIAYSKQLKFNLHNTV